MLSIDIQEKLRDEYASDHSTNLRKAFNHSLLENFHHNFHNEKEEDAVVVFMDIFGFSKIIQDMTTSQVRVYLEKYYNIALKNIYSHFGMIDRIAGDGILAVYSPYFFPGKAIEELRATALASIEKTIHHFFGTDHPSKGSITRGTLMFCKTGLTNIYEEATVLGHPITQAYRIDDHLLANQIGAIDDTKTSTHMKELFNISNGSAGTPSWTFNHKDAFLKGIGTKRLFIQTLS